jgi:hypothetical protein
MYGSCVILVKTPEQCPQGTLHQPLLEVSATTTPDHLANADVLEQFDVSGTVSVPAVRIGGQAIVLAFQLPPEYPLVPALLRVDCNAPRCVPQQSQLAVFKGQMCCWTPHRYLAGGSTLGAFADVIECKRQGIRSEFDIASPKQTLQAVNFDTCAPPSVYAHTSQCKEP